jgi:hypothetical protein
MHNLRIFNPARGQKRVTASREAVTKRILQLDALVGMTPTNDAHDAASVGVDRSLE